MTLLRTGLATLILWFFATGGPAAGLSWTPQADKLERPNSSTVWKPVKLCNGISKHTRTICCGAHPPAWCGNSPNVTLAAVGVGNTAVADGRGLPAPLQTSDDISFILRDPMFYICMVTVITVIYLSAQAGGIL